jgi:hypothetical protein
MSGGWLSRRQLLAGMSAFLVVPAHALACAPALHAFLHESGKPGPLPGRGFAVGGLFVAEPDRLAAVLAFLRQETGFRAPLRYSDTNRFKLDYARRAFDAFMEHPGTRFAAIVSGAKAWPGEPEARRAAYHAAYARLLQANLGPTDRAVLHRSAHRTVGPDEMLDEHLVRQGPTLRIAPAPSALADVGQFAAFLTGCGGALGRDPGNRVKSVLLDHVAGRLGVASLGASDLAANPKFAVSRGNPLA